MSRLESQLLPRECLFEGFDDETGDVDEPMKVLAQSGTREARDLTNRYVEGHTALQVEIGIGTPFETKSEHFRLVFEKVNLVKLKEGELGWRQKREVTSKLTGESSDDMHLSVPVDSSQIVDVAEHVINAEQRCVYGFKSVVRLYRLYPSLQIIREWIGTESRAFEFFIISENRKVKTAFVGGRFGRGEVLSIGKRGVVETRTQLIEEFSKQERQFMRRCYLPFEANDYCPITLHLVGNHIGVFVEKCVPGFAESISVVSCARDTKSSLFED